MAQLLTKPWLMINYPDPRADPRKPGFKVYNDRHPRKSREPHACPRSPSQERWERENPYALVPRCAWAKM